jgi:hypothetical protein
MTTQPDLPLGDPLQALVREHIALFRDDFPIWLALNRPVWDAFVREADRIRLRGREHYSARTIIEVLRHESMLAEQGSEWKINNNLAPDLARLYVLRYPDAGDFFEFRVMPGSERAA